jgi:hypothetical protein
MTNSIILHDITCLLFNYTNHYISNYILDSIIDYMNMYIILHALLNELQGITCVTACTRLSAGLGPANIPGPGQTRTLPGNARLGRVRRRRVAATVTTQLHVTCSGDFTSPNPVCFAFIMINVHECSLTTLGKSKHEGMIFVEQLARDMTN